MTYTNDSIILHQNKFTKDLLLDSSFSNFKSVVTPLPVNLKLSTHKGTLFTNPTPYRSLVGKLNFLTHTRPDLSYTIQTLSQFMQSPRDSHWKALKHTLNYVHSTCGQGIILNGSNNLTFQAFFDSDWGSCIDSRRSVTGFILMLGKSPIAWRSKKQGTVSRSSSEAEFRAMAATAVEVVWMVRLLNNLGIDNLKPVTLNCDNMSAIYIAKNPVYYDRTKHIEINCHFTREKVLEGLLMLSFHPLNTN